ncbi:MAG: hypothetical protein FWE88_05075 [Phycisphaerae bacterium]|nr:hypothetical protein [Phycisphaerae bacterium]
MKKALMWVVLAVVMFGASGCATPTMSGKERCRTYRDITILNLRMANEDWDYIWLMERSSMLTQWHPHVGL